MVSLIALLIIATIAGGLVPLLASRFREGGLHILVAVAAGLVLGAFLFHLAPEFLEAEHVSGNAALVKKETWRRVSHARKGAKLNVLACSFVSSCIPQIPPF